MKKVMTSLREWRLSLPDGSRSFAAAGKRLGISKVSMLRYEKGQRPIPPKRVIEFEDITTVPRTVLRPDVFDPPLKRRA